MAAVFLGLGSNESPEENLKFAVNELRSRYGELTVSPVYRGAAVGFDGADFLNLVVKLRSGDSPGELVDHLISEANGRGGLDNITVIVVGIDGIDRADNGATASPE